MDTIAFNRKRKEDLDKCVNRIEGILDRYDFKKSNEIQILEDDYYRVMYSNLKEDCVGVIYKKDNSSKIFVKFETVERCNKKLNKNIKIDNILFLESENKDLFEKIKKHIR